MFSASLLSCDTFVLKNYSWVDTPLLVLAQSTLEDNTLTIQSVALQMLLTGRAATVKYGSARVCAHSCYRIHLRCSSSHDYISPCVLSGLHHCSMELHHLRLLCPAKTVQQNVVCVWGDHKAVKGDVTGSAQRCLLEGEGHSPGLDGLSGLEQIPAPRWANTEKDKVLSQPWAWSYLYTSEGQMAETWRQHWAAQYVSQDT